MSRRSRRGQPAGHGGQHQHCNTLSPRGARETPVPPSARPWILPFTLMAIKPRRRLFQIRQVAGYLATMSSAPDATLSASCKYLGPNNASSRPAEQHALLPVSPGLKTQRTPRGAVEEGANQKKSPIKNSDI